MAAGTGEYCPWNGLISLDNRFDMLSGRQNTFSKHAFAKPQLFCSSA